MSKLAIMQPYFFPYIGYFSLIYNTDRFIILDDVQFIRHGWIERNRILNDRGEWIYIKVPLINSSIHNKICDIQINNNINWKNKITSQLGVYRNKAPYYKSTSDLIFKIFNNSYNDITSLNIAALQSVCDYLGINRKIELFRNLGIAIEQPSEPDEWALNICKAIPGVTEYYNPPGGISFFNKDKYKKNNIELKFLDCHIWEYKQFKNEFVPRLSIIDVLMFNDPISICQMLEDYEII